MMPSKIRYEWTGEYRAPKKGEYYLSVHNFPAKADCDWGEQVCVFILRRVESEVEDGAK